MLCTANIPRKDLFGRTVVIVVFSPIESILLYPNATMTNLVVIKSVLNVVAYFA